MTFNPYLSRQDHLIAQNQKVLKTLVQRNKQVSSFEERLQSDQMSDSSVKNLANSSKSILFSPPARNHSRFSINLLSSPDDKNTQSIEDALNSSLKSTSRFSKDFENLNKLTNDLSRDNQAKIRKLRPISDEEIGVSQRNSISENSANVLPFAERIDVHSKQSNEEKCIYDDKPDIKKQEENIMLVKDSTSPYIYIHDTTNQQAFTSPRITDKIGISPDLSNLIMKVSSYENLDCSAATQKEHSDIDISVKRYNSNSSEEDERSHARLKSMTLNHHNINLSPQLSQSKKNEIMVVGPKKNKRNNNYDQPFNLKQFSANNDSISRKSEIITQLDLFVQPKTSVHQFQLNLQTPNKGISK